MNYKLEFEIMGLPKMSNQLLGQHWTRRSTHAKRWKRAVWAKAWPFKPPLPLSSAVLRLTRVSSVEPDHDGLVSGFKAIIDGLVEVGVIDTDKSSCIGAPQYAWERCAPSKGKIRVSVEAA